MKRLKLLLALLLILFSYNSSALMANAATVSVPKNTQIPIVIVEKNLRVGGVQSPRYIKAEIAEDISIDGQVVFHKGDKAWVYALESTPLGGLGRGAHVRLISSQVKASDQSLHPALITETVRAKGERVATIQTLLLCTALIPILIGIPLIIMVCIFSEGHDAQLTGQHFTIYTKETFQTEGPNKDDRSTVPVTSSLN